MKITNIHLNHFKRFTDLTISDIPESAKLIVLVGPNGCGKTSLFEAFYHWYKLNAFSNLGDKDYFIKNDLEFNDNEFTWFRNNVYLEFNQGADLTQNGIKKEFYFRTAYRNESSFCMNSLSRVPDPTQNISYKTLMDNDICVSQNYQRLVSNTLSGLFDERNNELSVPELRDKLIGKIKQSLENVFEDLQFSTIGDPLNNGSFYFSKGNSIDYDYKNLSAGEKSAFDLILDLIIKSSYYDNAICCIDEPETHMHTSLQSKLLRELYQLVSNDSQLWLATHSIGMLKEAKLLNEEIAGSVVFIDFSNKDFDSKVEIKPSGIDKTLWNCFMNLAFGDFSKLVAPRTIIFCEGNPNGKGNGSFDSSIYNLIFQNKYPDATFVSIGSCSEIENPENISMKIIRNLLTKSTIIKLVDLDDKSPLEIENLNTQKIKVLTKRHIECYLFDDEIISKLCTANNKQENIQDCLTAKQNALSESISRGNPSDDIKSASGGIYNSLKKILGLQQCGNNVHAFLRDTMAPLVTENTEIYKELEKKIFTDNND